MDISGSLCPSVFQSFFLCFVVVAVFVVVVVVTSSVFIAFNVWGRKRPEWVLLVDRAA